MLHTLGFDAFGLPAEQYAIQTGTHPRTTTEKNIEDMTRQLDQLGLGHDMCRAVATTDPEFYTWTQWIFLQIYHAWFDEEQQGAGPIGDLVCDLMAEAEMTPAPASSVSGPPHFSTSPRLPRYCRHEVGRRGRRLGLFRQTFGQPRGQVHVLLLAWAHGLLGDVARPRHHAGGRCGHVAVQATNVGE